MCVCVCVCVGGGGGGGGGCSMSKSVLLNFHCGTMISKIKTHQVITQIPILQAPVSEKRILQGITIHVCLADIHV